MGRCLVARFSCEAGSGLCPGPASQLNQSLEEVARVLREEFRVNYRIFSTTVALRGAKWST